MPEVLKFVKFENKLKCMDMITFKIITRIIMRETWASVSTEQSEKTTNKEVLQNANDFSRLEN